MEPIKEITDDLFKYVLPDDATDEQKKVNPIAAKEIVEALKAGKAIEIINAVIIGTINLESIFIKGKVIIKNTKIKDPVDSSYAEFKKVLNFENSTFESNVIFKSATLDKDIILNEVTFEGETEFTDMKVKGALYGKSCTFCNNANFMATLIESRVVLIGATFIQKAMFTGSQIGDTIFFNYGTFGGEANFGNVHIKGRALFDNTTFEHEANFVSAFIGGCAEFNEAKFKNKVFFQRVRVEETGFFKKTNFYHDADFAYIEIQNNPEFTDSIFHEKAIFNSAYFNGHALFNHVIFKMDADFAGVTFVGGASFAGAQFIGNVDFYNSKSNMDVGFGGALFSNYVSFHNSYFRTVFLGTPDGKNETKFEGGIDLRGCIYDLIYPIYIWEKLMEKLDPFDRQPFEQLEGTFRRIGRADLADRVYYRRKKKESSKMKPPWPFGPPDSAGTWLLDKLHWLLTGYGIRRWPLLILIIIFLLLGCYIFQFDGAVEPYPHCEQLTVVGPMPETGRVYYSIQLKEAFWVSLNLFLPIDIPSGSEWRPSDQVLWGVIKFKHIGTILVVLGWILFPVAVTNIFGLLRR